MANIIRKNKGHYFQYIASTASAPSLLLNMGEIIYWVQEGAANDDGELLVDQQVLTGRQVVALPLSSAAKIYTLFIQGKNFKSEYELRKGGIDLQTDLEKQLENLPTWTVTKTFGTFEHRDESTYVID